MRTIQLVDQGNALMRAWELGDGEAYGSRLAEGARMTIPAHDLDIRRVEGLTVSALSHVISRATGQDC